MNETRNIVEIDQDKCDGCGLCTTSCAEGAIEIVDGKARLKAERYCDGLGACLGECPRGALKIIERPAEAFDEEAVHAMLAAEQTKPQAQHQGEPRTAPKPGGCPGQAMMSFARPDRAGPAPASGEPAQQSELTHWPVKVRLVAPNAPFLKGADLLIAADCAPVACAGLHQDFLRGRVVMIGCPKFDDAAEYGKKLAEVFRQAGPRSVTILRMEVPCCSGLSAIVGQAARQAGLEAPVEEVIVTRQGEIVRPGRGVVEPGQRLAPPIEPLKGAFHG